MSNSLCFSSQMLQEALLGLVEPSKWFERLLESGALADAFPEIVRLVDVPQDPKHHPEGNAYIHTMMVIDYAATIRNQAVRPLPFMLSALCHDFGKVLVTRAGDDGRIHSYGHEEAGISIAEVMLRRIDMDENTTAYVRNMVELHMQPNMKYAAGSKIKSTNQMFDRAVCQEDLLLLAEADHFGRLEPPSYDDCRKWLRDRLEVYREVMARPYVTKDDLLGYGAEPGNELDELMAYTHKLRVSGNTKESVEKAAKAQIRRMHQQKNNCNN